MTETPLPLRDLQAAAIQSLLGSAHDEALLQHIRAAADVTTSQVLSIYRHSMRATWVNTLRLNFPTVERLVGCEFFIAAADSFLQATPSQHGDLDRYGEGFDDHLGQLPASIGLPWLADLARFEWLLHELHRCPPEAALTLGDLAETDLAAVADSRLRLTRRAILFRSRWPVVRIWLANREHTDDPDFGGVDERPDRALVIAADPTRVTVLDDASWAFFAAVAEQETLLAAVDKALAVEPAFDFLSTFASALNGGAFASGLR